MKSRNKILSEKIIADDVNFICKWLDRKGHRKARCIKLLNRIMNRELDI